MRKYLMVSVACISLGACSFVPVMQELGLPTPSSYPRGEAYDPALSAQAEKSLADVAWNNFYRDETLKELISIGLENNNNLKTAALRISEARALYGIERSGLVPDVSADGAYTRQKVNASSSGLQGAGASGGSSGRSVIYDNYSVGLGFTAYELDFFGRVRSLNEAALNDYLSTVAALETVRITLISDIAAAYTSLRANQSLLKLSQETTETRQESYDLIAKRAEEGISSDLELAQAETLLLQAQVDLYQYLNAIAQDKNALRLLLGTPETMPDMELAQDYTLENIAVLDLPAGLPSDLLIRRPDVLAAEYQLYSANADIGAARAAFLPRISLTTTGGYSSSEFDNLFDSASQVWRFSPQITLPIFTGGRLKNNLDLAEVRKDIAVVAYEDAIETAFREVADALSAVSTSDERVQAQQNLVDAASKRTGLSNMRYDAGIENYLAVLDSKRELYLAQQNLILQNAAEINAKIALYRSLGGGSAIVGEDPVADDEDLVSVTNAQEQEQDVGE